MAEKDLSAPVISLMLAVRDAPTAVAWYKRELGARQLWSLGSVAGLEIAGAAFFVASQRGLAGRARKTWALLRQQKERGKLPNLLAVDFAMTGDVGAVAAELNGVARAASVTVVALR